jgi:hypothetical protein
MGSKCELNLQKIICQESDKKVFNKLLFYLRKNFLQKKISFNF